MAMIPEQERLQLQSSQWACLTGRTKEEAFAHYLPRYHRGHYWVRISVANSDTSMTLSCAASAGLKVVDGQLLFAKKGGRLSLTPAREPGRGLPQDRRPYYCVEEAAQRLGVTPNRVRQKISAGQIEAFKPTISRGNRWFIPEDQLPSADVPCAGRRTYVSTRKAAESLGLAEWEVLRLCELDELEAYKDHPSSPWLIPTDAITARLEHAADGRGAA